MRFRARLTRLLVAFALAVRRLGRPPRPAAATFRSGTRSRVAVRHRGRRPEAPRAGPDEGRFRGPRQRQAAAARLLRKRRAAHHRRRDARHERQHDRTPSTCSRQAAEQFLIRLLPDDKGRVGAFNDKIQISARFTNNRDDLISDVKESGLRQRHAPVGRDRRQPRRTARASRAAASSWCSPTATTRKARRAKLASVVERARAEEVMIYAIGLESNYFDGSGWCAASRTAACGRSPTKPAAATSS